RDQEQSAPAGGHGANRSARSRVSTVERAARKLFSAETSRTIDSLRARSRQSSSMAGLPTLQPGTVFARDFQVIGLLAEGGMGAVYVVEQVSTGKRRALKIM